MARIALNAESLRDALTFAQKGTNPRPFMPYLAMGLIYVHEGSIWARTFNGVSHSIVRLAEHAGLSDGDTMAVSLPKSISNLGKLEGEVMVDFDFEESAMSFRSGRVRWSESGDLGRDFIALPKSMPPMSAAGEDIGSAISGAAQSAANDKSYNTALRSVYISSNGSLDVVGADGYTIMVTKIGRPLQGVGGSILVPVEAADQIASVFSHGGPSTQVGATQNIFVVSAGDRTVITTLLSEKYPNYQAVMAMETEASVVISRQGLIRALQIASQYSDEETRAIILGARHHDTEKVLAVIGRSRLVRSSANVEVPYVGDADPVFKVDNKRFAAALRSISGEEEVMLSFDSLKDPRRMVIRPASNGHDVVIQVSLMQLLDMDREMAGAGVSA